jgi:hypothetical protein
MVIEFKKIKASSLIESIVAFTLILLSFGLGLTVITQMQSQQYLINTNALFFIKKTHAENKIEVDKKQVIHYYEWGNLNLEQSVKEFTSSTDKYLYIVSDSKGNKLLKYGFIENK